MIDSLMGRGHVPLSTSIDAPKLRRISTRRSPESVNPPLTLHRRVMSPHHHTASFRLFASSVLTNDDVIAAICKLPDKQCATDSLLPTNLLKDNVDVLAPFITEQFNRSKSSRVFPSHFKAAFITLLLKKPNLDPSDGKSYIDLYRTSVSCQSCLSDLSLGS